MTSILKNDATFLRLTFSLISIIFRLIDEPRVEFEKELDMKLKSIHLKRNINCATARRVAEDILAAKPELRNAIDKRINFSDKYFRQFFSNYGWKYGEFKGSKNFSP